MCQGNCSWARCCAVILGVLLGPSVAHAATSCVEPPAEAGFPKVTLQQVAQGLLEPVHIAVAPDGSGRLDVVEQGGGGPHAPIRKVKRCCCASASHTATTMAVSSPSARMDTCTSAWAMAAPPTTRRGTPRIPAPLLASSL